MPYAVEMRLGVQIPMRDGVQLSADIYLPKAHGPFPTVLVRTPYSNNSDSAIMRARALANNGYVCVLQDTRGRWDSGGDYYPLRDEGVDGYDTQEWIGRQPWSNGKIATSGSSYLGHVQWQSAPYGSHYLTAMTPRVIGPNFFKLLRPGGAFQLNVCATWGASTSEHTGQSVANTLRGDGVLALAAPGAEPADGFVYDPHYPVQTNGGNNCCAPQISPWGPYDQWAVEIRSDVLCYTSEPLTEDLEVTGPIKLVLYAATNGLDTDWTAKLVDVAPSGYAKNLCDGIILARYRESMTTPTLLTPNQIYQYEINVGVTGNVFRKGHRIRLEVYSSNFPRFDRNLNTGGSFGHESELRSAQQTVYHERAYPSHLLLPVIRSMT